VASSDHSIRPIDKNPYERRSYPDADEGLENLIGNWRHHKDNLIVFLGAGASVGARNTSGTALPAAYQLRNEIWRQFMCAEAERDDFDFSNLGTMTLEHAAALAEIRSDTRTLRQFVSQHFAVQTPLWQHAVLPFLKPKALCTTNYDNLVELGWRIHSPREGIRQLTPIYRAADKLSQGFLPLYKPHGTVEFPRNALGDGGLVLTQFDYFEILASRTQMLKQFFEAFNESCVIFIGYSFQDMDIASLFYEMRQRDRGVRWYAVFPRNDRDVRRMYSERYGILQINRTFHDFMVDLDRAVSFIPNAWRADRIEELAQQGWIAGGY
jgi:SIR2-like protein